MTISAIITWLIIGLVIGGLGHLLVPGRQRIGILLTLLFGVIGALVGGFITAAIVGSGHLIITFIVSVGVAAALVGVVRPPRPPVRLRRPPPQHLQPSPPPRALVKTRSLRPRPAPSPGYGGPRSSTV